MTSLTKQEGFLAFNTSYTVSSAFYESWKSRLVSCNLVEIDGSIPPSLKLARLPLRGQSFFIPLRPQDTVDAWR